ncbi:MAG: hypothetical protein J0652_13430 [Desulfobulbaceae bacterium]|nr:hypothetical protein [Desulfobulbaceae bacterium]
MIVTCPHCQKKLKPSAKIEESLRGLGPGKSLRISCPQCAGSILLDPGMLDSDMPMHGGMSATPAARPPVAPPPPPDLSALNTSQLEGKVMVEDIPKVLILMPDSADYHLVTAAMETLGYQPAFVQSPEEAMEKMQFITYASVILHSRYEEGGLENGKFHHFMRAMNMHKRRFIFYILIGPEFHTLYDLQALACSANLVVNERELAQLAIILRTAIPQYEAMFGAIMQEINALG